MKIPALLQGGVVTLGNFDGVHIGHQIMLQTLVSEAKTLKTQSIVVVFEPHPHAFFASEKPTRLMTLREKAQFLRTMGIDALIILPFNRQIATLSAQDFIHTFLKGALKAQKLVVGHDYHFGAGRAGDVNTLRSAGFDVIEVAPVTVLGERVSSTAIRQALQSNDLLKAEKYLGRRYSMMGKVRRGDGRGHELGFPTANMNPHRVPALRGVFAVKAKTKDGTIHPAVANLGTRPTVGGMQTLLEVHLLGENKSLYGEWLEVEFVQPIRAEQKFNTLDALKTQIAADVAQAHRLFFSE